MNAKTAAKDTPFTITRNAWDDVVIDLGHGITIDLSSEIKGYYFLDAEGRRASGKGNAYATPEGGRLCRDADKFHLAVDGGHDVLTARAIRDFLHAQLVKKGFDITVEKKDGKAVKVLEMTLPSYTEKELDTRSYVGNQRESEVELLSKLKNRLDSKSHERAAKVEKLIIGIIEQHAEEIRGLVESTTSAAQRPTLDDIALDTRRGGFAERHGKKDTNPERKPPRTK